MTVAEATKRCTQCEREQPLDAFYREHRRSDGRRSECKECHREGVRVQRERTNQRERAREYERRYRKGQGPGWSAARVTRYRNENPEKAAAHDAVHAALRTGELVRPDGCERCGIVGPVHGHHDDYSEPLVVRWLCPKCHVAVHQ